MQSERGWKRPITRNFKDLVQKCQLSRRSVFYGVRVEAIFHTFGSKNMNISPVYVYFLNVTAKPFDINVAPILLLWDSTVLCLKLHEAGE